MKKHLLLLLIVVFALGTVAYSQSTTYSGVINYETKANLHRQLSGERENMKAMVPEFRISNFQLSFDGNISLYKPVLEDDSEEMGSGGMKIQMRMPYSETYTDASSRSQVQLREFMGKTYLIEDSLAIQPWKMGEELREINGYSCRMAYYTDTTSNMEITAWYTMDLPPFIGPESFNTLPGTVLAVDFNNGERIIVARAITFRELKKNELRKPEKGVRVTLAEYRKVVDEQRERMSQNGGRMIIRN